MQRGHLHKILNMLEPEIRISQAIMSELEKQVDVACNDRAALLSRINGKNYRAIRLLITTAEQIQKQRARVEEILPAIQRNRLILIEAVKALNAVALAASGHSPARAKKRQKGVREGGSAENEGVGGEEEEVEEDEEEETARIDWQPFNDSIKVLMQSGQAAEELPALRQLGSSIRKLMKGRIASRANLRQSKLALRTTVANSDALMGRLRLDLQEMQKLNAVLKRQESSNKSLRDGAIEEAVNEAFTTASVVAQTSIDRLEKENLRLKETVLALNKKVARRRFAEDENTPEDRGTQCDPQSIADDVAASQRKKKKKGGKKKKVGKKKSSKVKKAEEEKSSSSISTSENPSSLDASSGGDVPNSASQHTVDEGYKELQEELDYVRGENAKIQAQMGQFRMEMDQKDAIIAKLQETLAQRSQHREAVVTTTGVNEHDGSQSASQDSLVHTATQYDVSDLVPKASDQDDDGKPVRSKRRRPKRGANKKAPRTAATGGIEVQAAPSPVRDAGWAALLISYICGFAAQPSSKGGIVCTPARREAFIDVARRAVLHLFQYQAFADLMFAHLALIVRKQCDSVPLLNIFATLMCMEGHVVAKMEGIESAAGERDTLVQEHCMIVLSLMVEVRKGIPSADCPTFLPIPKELGGQCEKWEGIPRHQAANAVRKVLRSVEVPKNMIESLADSIMKRGPSDPVGFELPRLIGICTDAWKEQYGRRVVQTSARFSMVADVTNWYDESKAVEALRKLAPRLTGSEARMVYFKGLEIARPVGLVTSAHTTTPAHPGVPSKTLIAGFQRALWMETFSEPKWLPSPEVEDNPDECTLAFMLDTWELMKRHSSELIQKAASKELRKLFVKFRLELKDVQGVKLGATVEEEADDARRMWSLLKEVGGMVIAQDDATLERMQQPSKQSSGGKRKKSRKRRT
eukprot:g1803.t1